MKSKSGKTAIQDALKAAMPKPSEVPAGVPPAVTAAPPAALNPPVTALAVNDRGERTSIGLFEDELALLDPLRDFMKARGIRRVGNAALVRLLMRTYRSDDSMVAVLRDILNEDGRGRKRAGQP